MFYYYNGEKPTDPCEKCEGKNPPYCERDCADLHRLEGYQDAISKLVEVDLDKAHIAYNLYIDIQVSKGELIIPFSQFIQEQMNLSNKSNSSQEALNDKDS